MLALGWSLDWLGWPSLLRWSGWFDLTWAVKHLGAPPIWAIVGVIIDTLLWCSFAYLLAWSFVTDVDAAHSRRNWVASLLLILLALGACLACGTMVIRPADSRGGAAPPTALSSEAEAFAAKVMLARHWTAQEMHYSECLTEIMRVFPCGGQTVCTRLSIVDKLGTNSTTELAVQLTCKLRDAQSIASLVDAYKKDQDSFWDVAVQRTERIDQTGERSVLLSLIYLPQEFVPLSDRDIRRLWSQMAVRIKTNRSEAELSMMQSLRDAAYNSRVTLVNEVHDEETMERGLTIIGYRFNATGSLEAGAALIRALEQSTSPAARD